MGGDRAFSERWIVMLSGEVRRLRLANEQLSLPKLSDRLLHLLGTEGSQGRDTRDCMLKQLARQLALTHKALYRALAELEPAQRVTSCTRQRHDALHRVLDLLGVATENQ